MLTALTFVALAVLTTAFALAAGAFLTFLAATGAIRAAVAFGIAAGAFLTFLAAAGAIRAAVAFGITTVALLTAGFIIAIAAVTVAATAAGAGAHLLIHGLGHLLITRGGALLYSQAEVLVHHGKHVIQHLAGFQEALAQLILHHSRAQLVKLAEFLLRGGHTLHVLVTQGFAIFAHLAEQIRGFRVLVEKTNTGLGGHYFLAACKSGGQFACELCQLWGKGSICHNA